MIYHLNDNIMQK